MSARNMSIWLGVSALVAVLLLRVSEQAALGQVEMPEVLIVGDSLAVGTMPYLGALLTDRNVTWDAVNGRTTPQGIHALRVDLRAVEPQAVVVSLGSNDGSDPRRFTRRLRLMLGDLSPSTCVIWTAIVRPRRKGAYRELNRALRAEAQRDHRLVVINWDHAVRRGTVFLRDGLHATPDGYRYRSLKIAQAVHAGCPAV
jgi:lysophospholipase L1-like esterase